MREFLYYYSVVGIEEEGEVKLYLYNAKDDSLVPFPVGNGIDPGPDPEDPFIFDMRVALLNTNTSEPVWMVASERFEILRGQTDGTDMVFHIKTLKDKMSMQSGVLFIVPANMTLTPQTLISASVQVTSPRKDDMVPRSAEVSWEYNRSSGRWGLVVTIEGQEMYGLAASSADHPWSWYYGFELKGRIPLT